MMDLGKVKPGSTIRIPFSSFAAATGASSATTGNAVGDILIFKDGSTTERASTSGYTFTVDFDAKTGLNVVVIDLADNTTAGFFAGGAEYLVAVGDITIDSQTVRTWLARFTIGHNGAVLDTAIASLASQVSFVIERGPAEDDALNGCVAYIHDVASSIQGGFAVVQDYTGSTKTVTLVAGTTFTVASTDNISFFPPPLFAQRAEPVQGTPAATTDPLTKLDYLYKAWRNRKTQTATQFSLYNDDAVTVDHKSTSSDDGTTASMGEIATGP